MLGLHLYCVVEKTQLQARDFAVFDGLGGVASNDKNTTFLMITQHTTARKSAS